MRESMRLLGRSGFKSGGLGVIAVLLVLSACMTPGEKDAIQKDVFNLQTRMLKLERALTKSQKEVQTTEKTASKGIASTRADVDRLTRKIRELRGELDRLRMGVVTGELPGARNSDSSVADTITELSKRVGNIEESQEELLSAVKNAGVETTTKKDEREPVETVEALQEDFDDKHYKYVEEDAPALIESLEGEKREKARFLFAESLYKLGQLRQAALKFNEFLESDPAEEYVPHAKMRMGDAFRHLGDYKLAKVYYEELLDQYPDSEEASKAEERLSDMGGAE